MYDEQISAFNLLPLLYIQLYKGHRRTEIPSGPAFHSPNVTKGVTNKQAPPNGQLLYGQSFLSLLLCTLRERRLLGHFHRNQVLCQVIIVVLSQVSFFFQFCPNISSRRLLLQQGVPLWK